MYQAVLEMLVARCVMPLLFWKHWIPRFLSLLNWMRRHVAPSLLRRFIGHFALSLRKLISGYKFRPNRLVDTQARGAHPLNKAAYSLDEAKGIAEKVLKSLRDNPLPMPPATRPVDLNEAQWTQYRYQCYFGTYHYAAAYMMYFSSIFL